VGNNGSIKDRLLAEQLISETFIEAYKKGWRPDQPSSAGILSHELATVCQSIDGSLLDKLALKGRLSDLRQEVIERISRGEINQA